MAKKSERNNDAGGADNEALVVAAERVSVIDRNIATEMRESFIDYAMSVITERALPDVRDGLKPVHRRILYAMQQKGLTASGRFKKSAEVVGEVLGSYHPHGDISVYDAMVKMAQDFATRYPLIIGQGNFGSIDGDGAAAYRYTEAKMSRIAGELLRDIEKETVNFQPNYSNTTKEPSVLPAAVPNLLLNGTLGIAVGMASNIPPHNLREVVDATVHLIENKDATNEELTEFVKGPDFPTGGMIFNEKEIRHAYATGRGGVVTRGEAEIIENKNGTFQIIITSIPFRVNKSTLIEQIADLHRDKKVEGIKDMRDESTKDIRIVIELKGTAHPQSVLNTLYKHTQLEETFHLNMVALVDGVPQTLSLKAILSEFILHRQVVVKRRTQYDLRKAEEREHILAGLKKALDHIDAIIKTIKASKDTPTAHAALMKEFKFSDRQATAILDMRLQKLAGLERKKIEDELNEVRALIEELKAILGSSAKMLSIIKSELKEVAEKYGDDRQTKVVRHAVKNFNVEDLIADEESILVLTKGGYIKRTNPSEYRQQKRGGVGVVDLDTKEEDFVTHLLQTTTHSDVLFFTDKGKAYQVKMYELPEGRRATRGKAIVNFLSLSPEEKITSILPMPKDIKAKGKDAKAAKAANVAASSAGTAQVSIEGLSILLVTRQGVAKKVEAAGFSDVRRSGLIAIKLEDGDELVSALFVEKGDEAIIVTRGGQSIRFKESDVREMGRNAVGVYGIDLDKGDVVVGADAIKKAYAKAELLVVSENGYGKKTPLSEYKTQKRGGSGIKTAQVTPKIGNIIGSKVVTDEFEELVAISKKSQVIRTTLAEIPSLGRQTQGVRVMKLREGDGIASIVTL